jgi:hypothetical protein
VILSSVRTKQPGFLKSQPRMNVALTRCRKGMVVVTDKSFLQGAGRSTLLGQLCGAWSRHHAACWIDSRAMLNNSGALPGLPAPSPSRPPNGTHGHNLNGRTPMPPLARNPPSQTRPAGTRTHQGQVQVSPLASGRAPLSPSFIRNLRIEQQRADAATVEAVQSFLSLLDPNYQLRGGGGHGGAHRQSAAQATVVRRDLNDDEFPSLQPLATALGPAQSSSSRQRTWPKGRK